MIDPHHFELWPFSIDTKFYFDKIATPENLGYGAKSTDADSELIWETFENKGFGIMRIEHSIKFGSIQLATRTLYGAYGRCCPIGDRDEEGDIELREVSMEEMSKLFIDSLFLAEMVAEIRMGAFSTLGSLMQNILFAYDQNANGMGYYYTHWNSVFAPKLMATMSLPNLQNFRSSLIALQIDPAPVDTLIETALQKQNK